MTNVFLVCGKPKAGTSEKVCTPDYGSAVSDGKIKPSTVTDTCNGNVSSQYTCTEADKQAKKVCTDYFNTGCQSAQQNGSWWSSNDASGRTPGISDCTYSIRQQVLGSSSLPDAPSMCRIQCSGGSASATTSCTTQCEVLGNCWSNSPGSGQRCQLRRLICTGTESTCSMMHRTVKCCP